MQSLPIEPGFDAQTARRTLAVRRSAPLWAVPATLIAMLLALQPAHAQIALVRANGLFGTTGGTTTTSSPLAGTPAIGNTIVVLLWTWTQNTAATINVTDTSGNTYTLATQATIVQGTGYESSAVYYAPITATSGNIKVTVTTPSNDSSTRIEAVAIEYSGIGTVDRVNNFGTKVTNLEETTTMMPSWIIF